MSDEKKTILKVDYGAGGVRDVEIDLPGNSKKSKENRRVQEEIEEVVEKKSPGGNFVKRNPGISKRFKDVFLGSEVKSIPDLLVEDVLVPQTKKILSDMIRGLFDGLNNAVDLVLFGDSQEGRRSRRLGNGRTDYNRRSTERYRNREDSLSRRHRARHDLESVTFDTKEEAIEIRDELVDLLEEYEFVTVNDFYEKANEDPVSITDSDYGWDNLSTAIVKSGRDGYYIAFPRPKRID